MLDKALQFGAGFDWITPLYALIMLAIGKHAAMQIHVGHLAYVRYTLRRKRITMRCIIIHPGGIVTFNVAKRQGALVRTLLNGVLL